MFWIFNDGDDSSDLIGGGREIEREKEERK